jgi:hypothetical protein
MTTPMTLTDKDLPGFHNDANTASGEGQRLYLRWSRIRLFAAVGAAIGGAFSLFVSGVDAFALLALLAFVSALTAELYLAFTQPERDWYAGRALAESTKTLAWRYAVRGAPFTGDIPEAHLREMLRTRMRQLAEQGGDHVSIGADHPVVTDGMRRLRQADFETRREAYITGRTQNQREWYAEKARVNKHRAKLWRAGLILGEIIAIVLATLRLAGTVTIDFAGILAAIVASCAAWLGLKQHAQLASAYRLTTGELAIQQDALVETSEGNWAQAVADAEEAISREHTMWLASRGEKPAIQS